MPTFVSSTVEHAPLEAHTLHSVHHPPMDCEPWDAWQSPTELKQPDRVGRKAHGRTVGCAAEPCSSNWVPTEGWSVRLGVASVVEPVEEARPPETQAPTAAGMVCGEARGCDPLRSSSPAQLTAPWPAPEGPQLQVVGHMLNECDPTGGPCLPDAARALTTGSSGCSADLSAGSGMNGAWIPVRAGFGCDGLDALQHKITPENGRTASDVLHLLADSSWPGIEGDPVDSMLEALLDEAPECAAALTAPTAEECGRLFGSRTCWGRGDKACEALEGLTMAQIVDLAAKFPWPPANITDPVLGGMCFARVLVDFWHPDNLVGQRAAGGGYFRRTLDSHGYPECECMRRNAAQCDAKCRRWDVKVQLAKCRNLFHKWVAARRKQAPQTGASNHAVAPKRPHDDAEGPDAPKRSCTGLRRNHVETTAGPRLPAMRLHFNTPISPVEGFQRMEDLRAYLAARGWPAEVYWACIEVQFATAPPGIAAEVAAMDVLAQLRGSCTSAFLQVGAGRAMQWTQGAESFVFTAPVLTSARMSSTWVSDEGWVMIAVTCTAEDEAEADLWREDHDSADVAGGGGTAMTLGEPALDQTLQEPGGAPVQVTISAASAKQSEIKRLPTRLLHRLEDGGAIVAIDELSCADAGAASLQLRLGRMLLDTCDVPSPVAAQVASRLEIPSTEDVEMLEEPQQLREAPRRVLEAPTFHATTGARPQQSASAAVMEEVSNNAAQAHAAQAHESQACIGSGIDGNSSAASPAERDEELVGQTVTVMKGPYMSYEGRAVSATGTHVRLELQEQKKMVIIKRSDLGLEDLGSAAAGAHGQAAGGAPAAPATVSEEDGMMHDAPRASTAAQQRHQPGGVSVSAVQRDPLAPALPDVVRDMSRVLRLLRQQPEQDNSAPGNAEGLGGAGAQQQQQQQQQPPQMQSPSLLGGEQHSGAALHSTTDPEKAESKRNDYIAEQVRWLLLLRHCAKCQAADDACQYGQSCTEARPLWRHVVTCSDGNCTYPRCVASRELLKHHQRCTSVACPVCTLVKQDVQKQRQGSLGQVSAVTHQQQQHQQQQHQQLQDAEGSDGLKRPRTGLEGDDLRRYQDRQKPKLEESEDKVAELTERLNKLATEKDTLAAHNEMLEKFLAMQQEASTEPELPAVRLRCDAPTSSVEASQQTAELRALPAARGLVREVASLEEHRECDDASAGSHFTGAPINQAAVADVLEDRPEGEQMHGTRLSKLRYALHDGSDDEMGYVHDGPLGLSVLSAGAQLQQAIARPPMGVEAVTNEQEHTMPEFCKVGVSARDRNRIAQRRYRDRQKTKLQESEGRVAELTESLRVLTSEKATLEAQIELLQKFLAGQSQQGGPPPSTPPPASQQPPTTASGGSGQVGTMVTGGVLRDRDGADGVHGSVSAVIKEEATLVVADKDGSKVAGGPVAGPGNNAMVNVLLDWLMPRLPADKQDQLLQAQADYGANSDRPGARQDLVAAVHGIAGRELIVDFHDQRQQVQDGSAAPAMNQPRQPDGSRMADISDNVDDGASRSFPFARFQYPSMSKTLGSFSLHVDAGEVAAGEVAVMLGENATGKTTFLKMLLGILEPDDVAVDLHEVNVSMKPQSLSPRVTGTVRDLLYKRVRDACTQPTFIADVMKPMRVDVLLDKEVPHLSGCELQRVAITMCLGKPADLYLIDEPSAYLASDQRMTAAKVIKRFIKSGKKAAFVVEHELTMAAYLADRVIVFDGQPSVEAYARSPQSLVTGMNMFLRSLDITFRRDSTYSQPREDVDMLGEPEQLSEAPTFRDGADDPQQPAPAAAPEETEKHWTEKPREDMTERDWRVCMDEHNISYDVPLDRTCLPIRSWEEADLPKPLLQALSDMGYTKPSPIQMAAVPLGLHESRDVIGIAAKGSGKTAAYLLPMLMYVKRQLGSAPKLSAKAAEAGPLAVILAPTREQVQQIEEEALKLAKYTDYRFVRIAGGQGIEEQGSELRQGCEVVVATPGRLLDCLQKGYVALDRCNYVVMDDADRMIGLFGQELMGVLDAMPSTDSNLDNDEDALEEDRNYRTTCMCSTRRTQEVERLARMYMQRPVVVTVGAPGVAIDPVKERVSIVGTTRTAAAGAARSREVR